MSFVLWNVLEGKKNWMFKYLCPSVKEEVSERVCVYKDKADKKQNKMLEGSARSHFREKNRQMVVIDGGIGVLEVLGELRGSVKWEGCWTGREEDGVFWFHRQRKQERFWGLCVCVCVCVCRVRANRTSPGRNRMRENRWLCSQCTKSNLFF